MTNITRKYKFVTENITHQTYEGVKEYIESLVYIYSYEYFAGYLFGLKLNDVITEQEKNNLLDIVQTRHKLKNE